MGDSGRYHYTWYNIYEYILQKWVGGLWLEQPHHCTTHVVYYRVSDSFSIHVYNTIKPKQTHSKGHRSQPPIQQLIVSKWGLHFGVWVCVPTTLRSQMITIQIYWGWWTLPRHTVMFSSMWQHLLWACWCIRLAEWSIKPCHYFEVTWMCGIINTMPAPYRHNVSREVKMMMMNKCVQLQFQQ